MTLRIDLQIACQDTAIPSDDEFSQWATAAWLGEGDTEITLRCVDESESQALNEQYRHQARPTNVLSFPFEAPLGVDVGLLGDLVICAPVVADEARQQGKSLNAHWAHMIVHGMLHLQGYDHIDADDAERMETLETDILAELGFANPYEVKETPAESQG